MLQREDYARWHVLTSEGFSADGRWCSYSVRYESGLDTLFVKRTDGKKLHAFPKGRFGTFNSSGLFACGNDRMQLTVFELETGKVRTMENVVHYQWAADGQYLLICQKEGAVEHIVLHDAKGREQLKLENIEAYTVSPSGGRLAYVAHKGIDLTVGSIDFGGALSPRTVYASASVTYGKPVWDKDSNAFVFVEVGKSNAEAAGKVHLYKVDETKLLTLDIAATNTVPKDMHLSLNAELITLTPDLKRVFFGLKHNSASRSVPDAGAVQLWNAADKWIYPLKVECDGWNVVDKVGVWNTDTGLFQMITDNEMPRLTLNSTGTHAVIHNPQAYEPQQRFYSNVDYYVVDLDSGKRELLLKDFTAGEYSVVFSPDGRYITYFKERNWWLYDIALGKHIKLTPGKKYPLDDEENDIPDTASPYSRPMWSADGKYFLYMDRYDIWKVTADGAITERLTNGREEQIRFRWVPLHKGEQYQLHYDGGTGAVYDLSTTLYLVGNNEDKGLNGYYSWHAKKGVKPIVEGAKLTEQLRTTANGDCLYVEQRYDAAPSLWIKKKNGKAQKLFQSNSQQQWFHWGKSELISYTNKMGRKLTGVLFYPADYQRDKQYPMIVEVYQKRGSELHRYVNPSVYSKNGFNATNYTSRGYFVLLPDMQYEMGYVGASAVDCTLSAIKAVQERASIDRKRIGLSGHSYGGYEVNFIITQTDVFAAAVSGAGAADLQSRYLDYSRNYNRPEMWRYEYDAMRMGTSLFENKEVYDRNSPVVHAKSIQTPLLLWTGADDTQVNPQQSLEFHLALRRLKKKNILLVYPEEGHIIYGRRNQYDLNNKIEEWFDHYLKGVEAPAWSTSDTTKG
ncbi:S9 family peptidase [Flavobacterium sp. PLA-1-15]|uniref:S9 family peptidase n=1 Tax=Flavobacterium sp. PLA-1-15 TaxID=3380533 RepID=UPI003B794F29